MGKSSQRLAKGARRDEFTPFHYVELFYDMTPVGSYFRFLILVTWNLLLLRSSLLLDTSNPPEAGKLGTSEGFYFASAFWDFDSFHFADEEEIAAETDDGDDGDVHETGLEIAVLGEITHDDR